VVRVIDDVDVSAHDKNVKRPGFERLKRLIEGRDIDAVVVWKLDRLVRRPSEFESFWESCETANVALVSATGPIDTSHELGLALVRILVTFASLESATISLRSKASNRAGAERGSALPGPTPYGFLPGMRALCEPEAAAIREAAARLIDGETVGDICRDWADRGITLRGRRFTPEALR
jgi:DNA invertase Pin-like site-specific DNA recombinase